MFASLGFKVDTTGLVNFKKGLANARGEMTNLGRGIKHTTGQLRGLTRELKKVDTQLGKIKGGAANTRIKQAYNDIASSVRRLDTALNSITRNRPATTKAIGKINSSVFAGIPHWDRYRESVVRTRIALRNLNGDLARLRANSRIDIRVNHQGGGSGGRGGSGGGGGGGGLGGLGGFGAALGLRGFLGNILPSMALGGAGAALGFGTTRMVATAREQTSMESMILMTSKSAEQFKHTIDYINTEAMRLGLNAADFGKSFAQVSMSAEKLSQGQKEKMFTGFSEFMMSMGTNADDQKGIFRAFNQMFSNNRILQEEINQLSDRGIPATLVYDAAMKAYGLDTVAQVKALQEDGKLDPSKVLTVMADVLQAKAHETGAYDKMQQSSMFKQNQFMSELRAASKEIMDSGLDEMLGDLFGQLTKIVTLFKDFATVVGTTYKSYRDFFSYIRNSMGDGTKFQLILYATFLAFVRMRRSLALVIPYLIRGGSVMRGLAVLMSGLFGRALGMIILRFGAWAVAIYAVSKAVSFLSDQIKRSSKGEWTFFDEMFAGAEKAGVALDILGEKLLLYWHNAKVTALNPWDIATNPSETFNPNTNARIPRPNPEPNTGTFTDLTRRGSVADALKQYSQKPKAGSGVFRNGRVSNNSNRPTTIQNINEIYVDGTRIDTLTNAMRFNA